MKWLLASFIFLCLGGSVTAQHYYVAFLKGNITYNGKPLAKRNRIRANGQLKFSSENDVLKVSGPGGVYTFLPDKPNGRGEFITALREELFPTARARGSYAANFAANYGDPTFFFGKDSYPQLSPTSYPLRGETIGRNQDLFLVATGPAGLLTAPATVKGNILTLTARPFRAYDPTEVHLVLVNDPELWQRRTQPGSTLDQLGMVSHALPPSGNLQSHPITLLNSYQPGLMNERKEVFRQLRRQLKYIRPATADTFLRDESVLDLFRQWYGWQSWPPQTEAFVRQRIKN